MAAHLHLALTSLRVRWRSSLLLLCCLAISAATLALGLVLRDAADRPWERAFERARGAHVVVGGVDAARLQDAVDHPDVVEASEPRAQAFLTLRLTGKTLLAQAVEAPSREVAVDRPVIIGGTEARAGGVVVEATMARTLDLHVGDRVELAPAARGDGLLPTTGDGPGSALRVDGIALVTSQAPFPATQPGLVLVDPVDLARITAGAPLGAVVGLRLRDPHEAGRVAAELGMRGVMTGTWQEHRAAATGDVADQRVVILTFAVLLLITASAAGAVLASGRAVAAARETALLRAVGVTPRGAVAVLVLEHGLLGVAGALAGSLLARPLAGRIVRPSVALLGSPPGGPPGLRVVVTVTAVLVAGVVVATALPVLRRQRVPAVVALAGATSGRTFGRFPFEPAVSRVAPLLALGLAGAVARPARRLLAMTTIALATAAAVASVGMDATLDREASVTAAPAGFVAASSPDLLRPVAYTLMTVLAVMSAAALLATTLTTAAEGRRDDALLRAAGATRRQLVVRTSYGAAATAAVAAVVGLPLGIAMFRGAYAAANGSADGSVAPSGVELLLVAAAVVMVCTALAAAVAAAAARVRPAEVLRLV